MIELSAGELIAIIVGLVALIVGIVAFMRANPNATPVEVDAEVARRLKEQQADRENVERLERAYQTAAAGQQKMFDGVVALLRFIAPITPIKSDDAALDLLTDIQSPGEPVTPPVG